MFALRFIAAAAAVAAVLSASAAAGPVDDSRFVGGFEDLPLMDGLVEDALAGAVFDTPAGRIVEVHASGPVAGAEVARFYDAVLPPLGWQPDGAMTFLREGERLRIVIAEATSGKVAVRFALSPE